MRIFPRVAAALLVGAGLATLGACKSSTTPTMTATATAASLVARGQSATTLVAGDTSVHDTLTVFVTDAAGTPVSGSGVAWAVTRGDGILQILTATTMEDGLAQSVLLVGKRAGLDSITATTAGLVPVGFAVTVVAGTPTSFVAVSGGDQSQPAGTTLAAPCVVRLNDAYGNGVAGATITWAVAGGGTLGATTTRTDSTGRATVTLTLGRSAGQDTVTATADSLPAVTFLEDGS